MVAMRPRPSIRRALGVVCLASLIASTLLASAGDAEPNARRIVSLNPSLTAILLALDAGDLLVGVDEFSRRQLSDVQGLPAVGGLFSPSIEAVTALSPDLVVLVPSTQQRSFRDRIEALGIRVLALPNITLDELLEVFSRFGRVRR